MRRMSLAVVVLLSVVVAFTVQSAPAASTGILKVVTPGVVVELKTGDKPTDKPLAIPNGKDVPLPVGVYKLAAITCYAQAPGKGAKPEMWSIKSLGPFGKLQTIDVQEGATTTVEAGGPFVLKAMVSGPVKASAGAPPQVYAAPRITVTSPKGTLAAPAAPGGKMILVSLAIVGKAGESYNSGTIMKGMTQAPAPQLRILDEKGTVLQQANFEYG